MTMKQLNSAITTTAKAQNSYASIAHTEHGAVTPLNTDKHNKAVARLIETKNPAEVDKRLVSSLNSITNNGIKEDSYVRYGNSGADIIIRGYNISSDSLEDIDRCIEAVQCSLATATTEMIESQLKMLSALVVKPSGETAKDVSYRIKVMATQLSNYPADIVIKAIEKVACSSTFWPSYAEFEKHINWRTKKRDMLLKALTAKKLELLNSQ